VKTLPVSFILDVRCMHPSRAGRCACRKSPGARGFTFDVFTLAAYPVVVPPGGGRSARVTFRARAGTWSTSFALPGGFLRLSGVLCRACRLCKNCRASDERLGTDARCLLKRANPAGRTGPPGHLRASRCVAGLRCQAFSPQAAACPAVPRKNGRALGNWRLRYKPATPGAMGAIPERFREGDGHRMP